MSQSMTFLQAWNYGGALMWVLAALSVLALMVVFQLLVSQRRGALIPTDLLSDILNLLRKGDLQEARRQCERRPCALSALTIAAIDAGPERGGNPRVKAALETEGSRIAERLQGGVDWLADLAGIAPLVGLLGTVLGMLGAFGGIASDVAANARPVVLAQGVSQAIVTTVFGLVVSIPCLAFHAMLRRRTAKRVGELEATAVAVENACS